MVHRLDMDTSGLMVVALTQDAYHRLQRQFLTRTIYKKYIALLDGEVWGEGSISLPLRPDHLDRPRQVVDTEHGKAAVTDYRVLEHRDGQTLVELTPHTGRTHQLRVHCAHQSGLNCPIVGDRLYGKPARRLCLHAAELAFDHPVTGQRLTFSSPVMF
jgi:tRNA pseudouridine32 synthase/23S rRNA pseudouridine746 synthase